MQSGRTIEVLGTTVQVPDGLERVRLSIGVQAVIGVGDKNSPASILLMNRKRLQKKNDPQFGLPGGAAELIDPEETRRQMADTYGIRSKQFENDRDARITDVPIGIAGQVVGALVNQINFPQEIARELKEEFGDEMGEFANISGGKIKSNPYQGPLPGTEEINFGRFKVFPVETSGRSDSASLRVQAVYEVNPPTELDEFIAANSKRLDLSGPMEVDTPMLVVPQAAIEALIGLLDKSAGESAILPDVKLAGTNTPVSIAGLIRLLAK